jgi:hypothetical protein
MATALPMMIEAGRLPNSAEIRGRGGRTSRKRAAESTGLSLPLSLSRRSDEATALSMKQEAECPTASAEMH